MFKYTARYKHPFTGEDKVEEVYCNLTAPELAKFEVSLPGGFREHARTVLQSGDGFQVLSLFETLVGVSYGRRTEDGQRFLKKKEWVEEFVASPAWEDFFLWLTNDQSGNNAGKFWEGLLSERMSDKVNDSLAKETGGKKIDQLSREELVALMQKTLDEKAEKAATSA